MDEFLGLDEDLRSVDKDGPKGSRNPLSLSLKTLDGQMYVYNNGNRIQRQLVVRVCISRLVGAACGKSVYQ